MAALKRTAEGVLPGQLAAIGLMTASLLGYEVLLTRAVAIQHWHHLTAAIVAVALLGLGSAGSLAAALAATVRRRERGLMPAAALATAAAMPLSLVLARQVPLNMLALPWYGVQQAGWLLLYALCFLLPFFCGAAFVTLAFMRWAAAIGRCYAADLGGSALGVILVLAWLNGYLLSDTSLESAFWLSALLPVPACLLLEKPALKRILCAAATALGVSLSFAGPLVQVVPSDFKALPIRLAEREARVLWQRDASRSRLTLVQSPAQHQAPGLSIRSRREAPRQWQVYRDGDAPLPLLLDAGRAKYRSFFEEVLSHAAFLAAPAHPRVLLLPGDPSWNAWSAHWHGAAAITVVAPDRGLADLLAGRIDAGPSFLPPGVRLDVLPARRFLQTSPGRYDLIMADVGGSPMGSAATRVAFMLTREALGLLLDRLPPEGVLAFSGRAMPLPREALRLIHSLAEVLRERRLRPAEHLVVLRDWQNLLVLVSPRPFSRDALDKVSAWCRTWAFDRAAMPGLAAAAANRFHQKQDAPYFHAARQLLSEDAAAFVAAYPFDLTATDDNRPFFYHFFRWGYWQALKDRLGPPWMLYAGWESLLGVLVLAVLLPTAALLIVAPLTAPTLRRQIVDRQAAILGYFGALGLGFMLIEIVLIQKVQLLMNSPTSAFAVVLVAMLLGAGGGSLWSSRPKARRGPPWIAALGVVVLAPAGPVLVDVLAARADALGRGLQVTALVLFLLVLAFPMGTLLPRGIARIRHRGAGAVAWAWGINGFCSVLGALAAPLIAIETGFLGVMGGAAGLYVLAAGLYRRLA